MPEGNLPYNIPSVVRVRAVAVLPASPTYGYSKWIACRGFRWATFYCEYDRGAAGGAVRFYLEWRPQGYLGAYQMSAYQVGAVVAGADTLSTVQRNLVTYTSVDADTAGFLWGPVEILRTAEAFKFYWTEIGDVETPGTFGVDVQMALER